MLEPFTNPAIQHLSSNRALRTDDPIAKSLNHAIFR